MKALVIDAYDSFVHTIVHYLTSLDVEVTVARNDRVTPSQVRTSGVDFMVLGPGPGHPGNSGYPEIIKVASGHIPTLGICLGHQAIGLAYGARVNRAAHLMHGKTSVIHHDGQGVFKAHASGLNATRYHSLIVEKDSVPGALKVTATSGDDGYVMGLRHTQFPVESVQFHPESILTEQGIAVFRSFISTHVDAQPEDLH